MTIGPFGQDSPDIFGPPPPAPVSVPSILGDPNQFDSPIGPPVAPTGDLPGLGAVETGGNILAVAGLVTSAIGSFYAAESQKSQLKSQAMTAEFAGSIANINARAAEADAVAIFAAGRRRSSQTGLKFGQIKAATRVSAAARGIQAGVGSAGEIATSVDLVSQVELLTIDANAFRAASAARRRAVDFRNQALLSGVSAENLRSSGRSISPGLQAFTTLLGGAGPLASGFAQRSRGPAARGRSRGVTSRG